MLTVHHLERGQSDRIVWLCEELEIPYELKVYNRDSETFMAPPELHAIHPIESAPIIQDDGIALGETSAIVEYILNKYGKGKLAVAPSQPNYADYLFYLHFANSSFQPAIGRMGLVEKFKLPKDDKSVFFAVRNFSKALKILDERLKASKWLAGDEFTAADIMYVFSFTTMRIFAPFSFEGYHGIERWLNDAVARPAYKRAMEKGDPGLKPPLTPAKPEPAKNL